MRVLPLKAEHVLMLENVEFLEAVTPSLAIELEQCGGWTVDDDGPVAVGGIVEVRPGVGLAWAWMARGWRKHARAITARVAEELATTGYGRVEAAVRCDFARGHNWMKRLGFTMEAERMAKWDGKDDFTLYARVR